MIRHRTMRSMASYSFDNGWQWHRRPNSRGGPLEHARGSLDTTVLTLGQSTLSLERTTIMSRAGAVTFKGNPMTLAGNEVAAGQQAPPFALRCFEKGALTTVTPADLKGKPTFISVVPSLDTPVCQVQTKKFNGELAALGDRVNALTVSVDLPFAMNRFCGAEEITNMRPLSDYFDRSFGNNWGMLIEELQILARGVFVLDKDGKVIYSQLVTEVAQEPDYEAALAALKGAL
jgi:thiol peroxidase